MSTLTVTQAHTLGVEAAKKALSTFEQDISKYGMKLGGASVVGIIPPFARPPLRITR